jgi:precorrin-2 dehydrogenase
MKKSRGLVFFPVLINLQKFPCLVVGGGKIAYRKVLSLLDFNADITVISPQVSKLLKDLSSSGKIKLIKKSYSKEYIKRFKIVFCATNNSQLNKTVYKDCVNSGILINVADNPSLCDFIIPANIKRGDLTVSVSSQGKAPFFTKEMKEKLNALISPIYTDIVHLAGEFRKKLLLNEKSLSTKDKTKMFKKFTSINWEKVLTENLPVPKVSMNGKAGGEKRTQHYIQKILRESELF